MCIQFAKGKCKDGDRCRYAHHIDTLRKTNSEEHHGEHGSHVDPSKTIYFEEDKTDRNDITESKSKNPKHTFNIYNLRKEVHSSDYESDEKDDKEKFQYNPTQHRYNYLNPFFFYSFNNFPVYYPVTVNHTMPFFNYITINNNSNDNNNNSKPTPPKEYVNESNQFNSKSNDESRKKNTNANFIYNSYKKNSDANIQDVDDE